MEQHANKIECPNCGQEIDVNELLYHKLDDELKKKYNDEYAGERKKYDEQLAALAEKEKQLISDKEKNEEMISQGIQNGVTAERNRLKQEIKEGIEKEHTEQVQSLQDELNEKSSKVSVLGWSDYEEPCSCAQQLQKGLFMI